MSIVNLMIATLAQPLRVMRLAKVTTDSSSLRNAFTVVTCVTHEPGSVFPIKVMALLKQFQVYNNRLQVV